MATKQRIITELTNDELAIEVSSLRQELFKLRWQAAVSQLEKPHRIGEVRRDIARRLTEQRARAGTAGLGAGRTPAAAAGRGDA